MTSNPIDNNKSSEDINPSSTGVSFSNEPADLPAYRKHASVELKDFNSRASLSLPLPRRGISMAMVSSTMRRWRCATWIGAARVH